MFIINEGLTINQQDKEFVRGMMMQSRFPSHCFCNC